MPRGLCPALRGAPVAQSLPRDYQGVPLVNLFSSEGVSQDPSCAQGAQSRVQRGSVAHSGAVGNQGPFISLRGPLGSRREPRRFRGPRKNWPTLENMFRRHLASGGGRIRYFSTFLISPRVSPVLVRFFCVD